MKKLLFLLCALALQACAGSRTADLDIGEHSFFLVDIPPQGAVPGVTRLIMARYDPATQTATDWEYDFQYDRHADVQWNVIAVSPGDYVLMSLGVFQGSATWSACLGEATYRYSIGEDEIVYLGTLDPTPSLSVLGARLEAEGRDRASAGQFKFAHHDIPAPAVAVEPPSDAALARAREAFAARRGDSALPLRWEAPTPAAFETPSGVTRMVSCGG